MTGATIRPMTGQDFASVGLVGPASYAAAYGYLWDQPNFLSAQLESYGPAGIAAFMARADARAWVAEGEGRIVGFLTLLLDSPDPVTREPGGAEIPRIYLLPGAQGLGLGRALLEEALKAARDAGCRYVWLDVMDTAKGPRAAYKRWGFTEIGTRTFDAPVKAGHNGMMVGRQDLC